MPNAVQFKVCGLTSAPDAEAAVRAGAGYLGFNLYPKSPRYLPLDRYRELAKALPPRGRVAVMVEPTAEDLAAAVAAGFDFFQIHFRADTPAERLATWSELAGKSRLILAPKLPPAAEPDPAWLRLADTVMLDTFSPEVFGGTGRTGDWGKFARIQAAYPGTQWILSGGLSPANISEAVRLSGARFVDVASGVESAPGVKDHAKLRALGAALQEVSPRAG
jgi:phosphoribosylanthranilate isomerase